MPTAMLSLSQMVDLALGTPEVGAVNFNVLHTLFHAIIDKLNIGDIKANINEEDKDFLSRRKIDDKDTQSEADSAVADLRATPSSGGRQKESGSHVPYHALEQKVTQLQNKLDALNDLPSNSELFERAKSDGEKPRPVSDMWQTIQLARRVDANEDGVNKLMSLVEDMMREMQNLREQNDELQKQLTKALSDAAKANQLASDLEDVMKRLRNLEGLMENDNAGYTEQYHSKEHGEQTTEGDIDDTMTSKRTDSHDRGNVQEVLTNDDSDDIRNKLGKLDKLDLYPDPDVFNNFVTWTSLEDALKGIRDAMDDMQNMEKRVVIDMSSQTVRIPCSQIPGYPVYEIVPCSRPQSSVASRPQSSRTTTPGPSNELVNILERLGHLSDEHDKLEERVKVIEEELKNKADKGALDGLGTGVPDDLLNQLKDLNEQLDALKKGQLKDNEALTRLQQAIIQLQSQLERISNTMQELVDESDTHKKHIKQLGEQCNKLEEVKADKEYVQTEVETKADKCHLDSKVNRTLFDTTCDDLNKMINDILSKLTGHEDDWKKAVSQLSDDLDGKLDRLEFGPIRDELERQLKALMKRLNNLRFGEMEDDDAAGIRKQLIQRFHCISCDRPVDMAPHGPVPSIPAPTALPATRSTRPYTTFELDTIRQHAKSAPTQQVDIVDLFTTARACGGSHTLTYPQRRMTRLTQVNSMFKEDEFCPTVNKDELEIQGADGHIYKGRVDDKLPHLVESKGSPVPSRKVQGPYPPTGSLNQSPVSSRPQRPGSANLVRPSSSHVHAGSRPSSATNREMPRTEVPTGRGFGTPPPAPAPSEPDQSIMSVNPALQVEQVS
ncbi:hypothetical protein LSH36_97g05033 [Paralvinella palmiformis]|uniref:DUF4795 domain-containing protein n=1 Tax=Paralvinella palmiformis TaxID=53620 RepID=A0AAD9K0N1_9ANNE|nr:hypothetical protein LSH36_97g05033 [Paralvinella palmiformis]